MRTKSLIVSFFVLATQSCGGSADGGGASGNAGRMSGSGGTTGGAAGTTGGSGATSGGTTGGVAGTSGASGGTSGGAGGTTGGAAGTSGGVAGTTAGSAGTSGGGGADYGACSLTSECMVRPESCCGNCGAATRNDVIAINRANAGNYTLAMCMNSGCPACYAPQDPTLLARCEGRACRAVDLKALALTECAEATDCRLRTASCCECGGDVSTPALIAIRKDSEVDFQSLACDPGTACDECVPPYPTSARPRCVNGRCEVGYTLP